MGLLYSRVLLSKRYGTPCDLYVGQNVGVGRHGFLDSIYIFDYKQTNKQNKQTTKNLDLYVGQNVGRHGFLDYILYI